MKKQVAAGVAIVMVSTGAMAIPSTPVELIDRYVVDPTCELSLSNDDDDAHFGHVMGLTVSNNASNKRSQITFGNTVQVGFDNAKLVKVEDGAILDGTTWPDLAADTEYKVQFTGTKPTMAGTHSAKITATAVCQN